MVLYSFGSIVPVPDTKSFIDIIFSSTQRKTPTVVHKGYKISRIRNFYMRKVKFTQQNFHDKMTLILEGFPRLDNIHPFYADLMNILYSRDHYKLALGQLNIARTLINKIGKDYIQLLKFGDSLYRCKELKRAALGRMATVLKKLNSSLVYLEKVRQHLSRLPSIDPTMRTMMITGYPNVGKSSFINKISRADVDVQPYAFTTKSLFVGHTDYRYIRWQVIDSPGILDHPLEDRNTIEMQAITALAHLQSVILFFIDVSEQCGYDIKKQVSLYHSIKPLFQNKPTVIVINKIDQTRLEDLDEEDRALIDSMTEGTDIEVLQMSARTEEGVMNVRNRACDLLLEHRVQKKLKGAGKMLHRIQVTKPTKRDEKKRSVHIPESVLNRRKNKLPMPKRKTQKEYQDEYWGAGIYAADEREEWLSVKHEWRHDIVPEFFNGKNVVDFIDPEIEKRLDELEAEEAILEKKAEEEAEEDPDSDLGEADLELLQKIIAKRRYVMNQAKLKRRTNSSTVMPRSRRHGSRAATLEQVEENLNSIGIDTAKLRARSKSRGRKRTRSLAAMDTEEDAKDGARIRGRSRVKNARLRSVSVRRRSKSRTDNAFKDDKARDQAEKRLLIAQKPFQQQARTGPGDRRYFDMRPKHLNIGKRGIGKMQRR